MVRGRGCTEVLSCLFAVTLLVPACGGGGGGGGGGNGGTASWTHPASLADNISPDGQDVWDIDVAMDGSGNAIVVWNQYDGTSGQIYMSEYRNGVWTNPDGFGDSISPYGTMAEYPDVAMDDSGNAIVVWHQEDDGMKNRIFKSERRNGSWTPPENLAQAIDLGGGSARYPQVAMGNNGDAVIVWSQYSGGADEIFMCEYRSGVWSSPEKISLDSPWAFDPQVAMGDSGDTIVVWSQSAITYHQIFKSEYRDGTWTHPSGLTDKLSPDGSMARYPQVAMTGTGSAVVVWQQQDGSNTNQVFKSECRGGEWTNPTGLGDNISLFGKEAYPPRVAVGDDGSAVIVWSQFDGATWRIYMSDYRNGQWTKPDYPTDAISPEGKSIFSAEAAMDDDGNALVVWSQGNNGFEQIYMSEYRDGAWTHPSGLTDDISPGDTVSYGPVAVMSGAGTALIAWYQSDGAKNQTYISEYR